MQKEEEKKIKHKNSCTRGKTDVLHVLRDDTTNRAKGIEAKGLEKNLKVIPGKHSRQLLQQTATLGT